MKIALLGDIGLLGNYSLINNPNLQHNLKEVADFLSQFDYVVGNLETPFTYKHKHWGAKSAYICTDPQNIEVLKMLHTDAVTIANNHMFDFGKEGFETTINLLDKSGIKWFGANGKSLSIERDNNRIKFEGFCCYSTNPLKIAKKYGNYGINRFDLQEVTEILKNNTEDGWLSIFAIHSGIEHVNTPSIDQIRAASQLSKTSRYIWYGHHPHVVQGIEHINGSVIAHSLGNFCFAGNEEDSDKPVIEQLTDNNRTGLILILNIDNNIVTDFGTYITNINDDGTINVSIDHDIVDGYSKQIKECEINISEYKNARIEQRNMYLVRRKEMRNLKWVMKRLRPRYARLLLDNFLNGKRYQKAVINYLKKQGFES